MPLGMKVGLGPGDFVLDGDPAPLKGAQQPPSFRPMYIVAKRSPISASAEHLLCVCLGLALCVCFSFSLDYFVPVLFAFVVLGLRKCPYYNYLTKKVVSQ